VWRIGDRSLLVPVILILAAVQWASADGRVVYSINSTTPQNRVYTSATNSFAAAAALPDQGATQSWFQQKLSPTRIENLAGYVSGTTLYVLRWNGSAWSAEWNVNVGSNTNGRRFDIAYEQVTGDAIVTYSTNVTTNELAYRIWNGTTWTAAQTLNSNRTTAIVRWVKMASRPSSDTVALVFEDANRDLSAFIWDGSAWGNEPAAALATDVSSNTNAGDYEAYDLAYESQAGDLMVVWGSETTYQDAAYVTFSGGTWGAVTELVNQTRIPAQVSLTPDPLSNRILLAYNRDAGSTNFMGDVWSGTAWGTFTRLDLIGGAPTASAANKRHFSTGWLNSGGVKYGIVAYSSTTNTTTVGHYRFEDGTGTWTLGAVWTPSGNTIAAEQWSDIKVDPDNPDTLMLTFSDANSDLWAKRLVLSAGPTFSWTDADGGAALTTTLATINMQNFSFVHVPPRRTLVGTGTDPANGSICPGDAGMVDSFSISTTAGIDSITAATVTLSSATSSYISLVEITDDTGATVYGSAANPASDTVAITLTTPIPATTTPTQYKVRLTAVTQPFLPAPPGAGIPLTALITAITCSNPNNIADTTSATITIDNLSPSDASWTSIVPGDTLITLNWTNPGDADFAEVVILRSTSLISDRPAEGTTYTAGNTIGASTVAYAGNGTTTIDGSLINGTYYYYKIFARDNCRNYSAGVQSEAYAPLPPTLGLTTQPASATINNCTRITIYGRFTGDTDVDSTTNFERGTSLSGPWTAVCTGYTGGSPRTCVDNGVTAANSYYYRITFADLDGVSGANPIVIGPYTTPACNPTAVGTVSAIASSCRQIIVTGTFTGDGNANGTMQVEYNTSNTWPGTVSCAAVGGDSPRTCLVIGLSPGANYWIRATFADADGVSGSNPQVVGAIAVPACGADQVAPTITFMAPARGSILSGSDLGKVQVYDEAGLRASNPVEWSLDSGPFTPADGVNTNYNCEAGCSVYQFTLNTFAYANGLHSLTVRATDAAGNVAPASMPIQIRNTGGLPAGSGMILRRTQGSQVCLDCHNLQTHNSQYTSTKYGNWSIDCMVCHTPHQTRNIYLVRENLLTPNSGQATVVFRQDDLAGGSNPENSYLGSYSGAGNTPYNDGICEVCHTRTNHYRNSSSGGDHTHNQNTRCVGCHRHQIGFAGRESKGCTVDPVNYATCSTCHGAIWNGMNGTAAKTSKHTLGATVGTNDTCSDSGITWGPVLSTNAAAVRSCVNMCHPDHVHNLPPVGTTHANNAHQDATTQTSRGVTRDAGGNITAANTAGSPNNTDFDNSATNGGMCLSCHRFPVESGANPAHPAVDQSLYDLSAHNYTDFSTYGAWTYTQHDSSTFSRNCVKCHADRGDNRPGDSATPFGAAHFSDYASLLAGTTNPNNAPATFVCYNCHGNGTTGTDYSGKAIATQVAKTSRHPADADAVHDSLTEYNNAAFGNALGGLARHSNCMDCHETHQARAGASVNNTAGPPLQGAWGAQLSSDPAFWTLPTAGNFTKKTIVAGTDLEATLCFKCHSGYYGTLPNSPSGGYQETDTSREFNPNNLGNFAGTWADLETAGSFHPVLASAGNNLGATSNIVAPWTRTSLMTCSDCHASDTTTDPAGPHGSAAGFLLKGPNTAWSVTLTTGNGGMPAGTFCINCHNQNFTNSRFPDHTRGDHYIACWNCHSRIPHGTGRPGLLVASAGYNATRLPAAGSDSAPYAVTSLTDKLYLHYYPANNTSNWQQNMCGCNGTGH